MSNCEKPAGFSKEALQNRGQPPLQPLHHPSLLLAAQSHCDVNSYVRDSPVNKLTGPIPLPPDPTTLLALLCHRGTGSRLHAHQGRNHSCYHRVSYTFTPRRETTQTLTGVTLLHFLPFPKSKMQVDTNKQSNKGDRNAPHPTAPCCSRAWGGQTWLQL